MTIRRFVVPVTTDADGDATAYSPRMSRGSVIQSIHYIKPGSGGFANTADFAITHDETGEGVWTEANLTATAHRRPRAATHSTAGVAALYAAGGTAVNDAIAISAGDRVKIVVAEGGNALAGTFHIVVEG